MSASACMCVHVCVYGHICGDRYTPFGSSPRSPPGGGGQAREGCGWLAYTPFQMLGMSLDPRLLIGGNRNNFSFIAHVCSLLVKYSVWSLEQGSQWIISNFRTSSFLVIHIRCKTILMYVFYTLMVTDDFTFDRDHTCELCLCAINPSVNPQIKQWQRDGTNLCNETAMCSPAHQLLIHCLFHQQFSKGPL